MNRQDIHQQYYYGLYAYPYIVKAIFKIEAKMIDFH